jgi:hypothetical protein
MHDFFVKPLWLNAVLRRPYPNGRIVTDAAIVGCSLLRSIARSLCARAGSRAVSIGSVPILDHTLDETDFRST